MALVMISSLYQGGREELAGALAAKTGWPLLSQEELHEQAKLSGIRVGRLETSIIKRPPLSEKLARERNAYLAFLTSSLCEKALHNNLIYHGRAGHLLLPGVNHKLRVGLTAPWSIRIQKTAQALQMQPEQAESYLHQLEDDVGKWVRYIHQTTSQDPGQFDVFFNLENLKLGKAAEITYQIAQHPEYQGSKADQRIIEDLHIAAQARLRLFFSEQTRGIDLKVEAEHGVLTVTYPPQQAELSSSIPQTLNDLPGCREIQCTMAETNILWVQEQFDPESENFQNILQLAQRWGAAVELMRLIPPDETQEHENNPKAEADDVLQNQPSAPVFDGGVEDDDPNLTEHDGGLGPTIEKLIHEGRCGGGHMVSGGYEKILERARGVGDYTLVVVGNIFLSKGQSTRTRRTRELTMSIRDRLKAPVINTDELKSRFLFGKRQAMVLLANTALVVLLYFLVFTNQQAVLNFLSGPIHQDMKWLAPLIITLFIPTIAYLYSTVTGLALKIINID